MRPGDGRGMKRSQSARWAGFLTSRGASLHTSIPLPASRIQHRHYDTAQTYRLRVIKRHVSVAASAPETRTIFLERTAQAFQPAHEIDRGRSAVKSVDQRLPDIAPRRRPGAGRRRTAAAAARAARARRRAAPFQDRAHQGPACNAAAQQPQEAADDRKDHQHAVAVELRRLAAERMNRAAMRWNQESSAE